MAYSKNESLCAHHLLALRERLDAELTSFPGDTRVNAVDRPHEPLLAVAGARAVS